MKWSIVEFALVVVILAIVAALLWK